MKRAGPVFTRVALPLVLLPALALAAEEGAAPEADPEPGSPAAVELAVKIVVEADKAAREGRVARALDIARRVAHLAPAAPGAQKLLGDLYMTVGDCSMAMAHYRTFVRLGRDDARIRLAQRRIAECENDPTRQGTLKVAVLPAEAAVRVVAPWQQAPIAAGQGEASAKLPVGLYRVHAALPGHAELDTEVRVLPAKTVTVAESLPLRPAALVVESEPAGARIRMDGGAVGEAPVRLEPVTPGDHDIETELDGYVSARSIVRVQAGQEVRLTLRPEPAPARFNVSADAPDARVELDGTVRCRAPCDVEVPGSGRHRLRVLSPGYLPTEQIIEPTPGQTGEIELHLQETAGTRTKRSRTRWAIGLGATGAALAVSGAIALGAGFATASEADDTYARYQDAGRAEDAVSLYARAEDLDERAQTEQLVGYGLLGAAVTSGVVATVLWATADGAAHDADQQAAP